MLNLSKSIVVTSMVLSAAMLGCERQEVAPANSAPKTETAKSPAQSKAETEKKGLKAETEQASFQSSAPPTTPPGVNTLNGTNQEHDHPHDEPNKVQAPVEPGKPSGKISFREKEHNFGKTFEGDPCVHSFEFKNEGPGELKISNVQPSCGCTTKKVTINVDGVDKEYIYNTPIPEGTIGHIEASLNTTGYHGPKTSRISVYSTDQTAATTLLTVQTEVEQFFKLEPPSVAQGMIFGKAGGESLVKITCLKADSFEVKNWEPVPEGLSLEFTKPDAEKKNYGELKIKFLPGVKEGMINHTAVLHTTIPGAEKPRDIRVTIMATIMGAVMYQPAFLGFGLVQAGKAQTTKLNVQNRDPQKAIKITEVTIDSPQKEFLSTNVKTDMEGQTYVVELTVSEKCPPGIIKGTLMVKTDHPESAEKKVSFSGVVREVKNPPAMPNLPPNVKKPVPPVAPPKAEEEKKPEEPKKP